MPARLSTSYLLGLVSARARLALARLQIALLSLIRKVLSCYAIIFFPKVGKVYFCIVRKERKEKEQQTNKRNLAR